MLYCFIGQMGGGKTLSAVRLVYLLHKRFGYKIYSNIHLNLPYERFNKKKLKELIRDKEKLKNIILLIDELHTIIDSRSSMSKDSKALSYFINQTRKRNVTLIGTTQSWRLVDVRFRNRVHQLIYCRNLTPGAKKDVKIMCEAAEVNDDDFIAGVKKPSPPMVFRADPFFSLYDTNEIVEWEDVEEEGDGGE